MIRELKKEDIEELLPLMESLFKTWEDVDKYDELDREYFYSKAHVRELEKLIKKSIFLVAVEDNKIAGFILAEIKNRPGIYKIKKEGHILLLYVEEDYRKKGIGKMLIENVLERFKDIKFITVNTHALDGEANEFWKKKGFRLYNLNYVKEE